MGTLPFKIFFDSKRGQSMNILGTSRGKPHRPVPQDVDRGYLFSDSKILVVESTSKETGLYLFKTPITQYSAWADNICKHGDIQKHNVRLGEIPTLERSGTKVSTNLQKGMIYDVVAVIPNEDPLVHRIITQELGVSTPDRFDDYHLPTFDEFEQLLITYFGLPTEKTQGIVADVTGDCAHGGAGSCFYLCFQFKQPKLKKIVYINERGYIGHGDVKKEKIRSQLLEEDLVSRLKFW